MLCVAFNDCFKPKTLDDNSGRIKPFLAEGASAWWPFKKNKLGGCLKTTEKQNHQQTAQAALLKRDGRIHTSKVSRDVPLTRSVSETQAAGSDSPYDNISARSGNTTEDDELTTPCAGLDLMFRGERKAGVIWGSPRGSPRGSPPGSDDEDTSSVTTWISECVRSFSDLSSSDESECDHGEVKAPLINNCIKEDNHEYDLTKDKVPSLDLTSLDPRPVFPSNKGAGRDFWYSPPTPKDAFAGLLWIYTRATDGGEMEISFDRLSTCNSDNNTSPLAPTSTKLAEKIENTFPNESQKSGELPEDSKGDINDASDTSNSPAASPVADTADTSSKEYESEKSLKLDDPRVSCLDVESPKSGEFLASDTLAVSQKPIPVIADISRNANEVAESLKPDAPDTPCRGKECLISANLPETDNDEDNINYAFVPATSDYNDADNINDTFLPATSDSDEDNISDAFVLATSEHSDADNIRDASEPATSEHSDADNVSDAFEPAKSEHSDDTDDTDDFYEYEIPYLDFDTEETKPILPAKFNNAEDKGKDRSEVNDTGVKQLDLTKGWPELDLSDLIWGSSARLPTDLIKSNLGSSVEDQDQLHVTPGIEELCDAYPSSSGTSIWSTPSTTSVERDHKPAPCLSELSLIPLEDWCKSSLYIDTADPECVKEILDLDDLPDTYQIEQILCEVI